MRVPPETRRPVLLHHPARKSVGYFGAVRLRDGKMVLARECDKFNAASCWNFLKLLRVRSPQSGRRVIVILDNARYHHARLHRAWPQDAANRFALDFLPPYSPDLNPTERVGKLTRRLAIHNRYFPLLDSIIHALENQFPLWEQPNDALRRLCAFIYDAEYSIWLLAPNRQRVSITRNRLFVHSHRTKDRLRWATDQAFLPGVASLATDAWVFRLEARG